LIRIGLFVGRLLILLVVGVFVSACGSAQSTSSQAPSSRPPSNPLIIGAPLAISGAHSVEGNLTKNGYDLWADEVNKAGGIRIGRQRRMVQIKYYDDESDAQKKCPVCRAIDSGGKRRPALRAIRHSGHRSSCGDCREVTGADGRGKRRCRVYLQSWV